MDPKQHTLMLHWLYLLSAIASRPTGTTGDANMETCTVVKRLNELGICEMIAFLISTEHPETVRAAALLAVCYKPTSDDRRFDTSRYVFSLV